VSDPLSDPRRGLPRGLLSGIDAVIFDVDDTLVPTRAVWQRAVDLTCTRATAMGAGLDPAKLAAAYTLVSDALWSDYQRALEPLGSVLAIRHHVWDQALRACGAKLSEGHLKELVAYFASTQLKAIRPDPLLARLLAELSGGYHLAACSNGDRTLTRAKLTRAGLLTVMGVITCGIDERTRKPDPELLRRCCRALGVPPARCLHIGDDWSNDVEAASQAGLRPVWICPRPGAAPAGPPSAARYPTIIECLEDLLRSGTTRPVGRLKAWPG
jgi:HAD superfamily hydrolase (TIGR01549 family)